MGGLLLPSSISVRSLGDAGASAVLRGRSRGNKLPFLDLRAMMQRVAGEPQADRQALCVNGAFRQCNSLSSVVKKKPPMRAGLRPAPRSDASRLMHALMLWYTITLHNDAGA